MSLRRNARELALQRLYSEEFPCPEKSGGAPVLFWKRVTPEAQVFALRLIDGVNRRRNEIDGLIRKYAENWPIERMAKIDRVILRFCIFEMLHMPDVPRTVAINEAIEIAKKYGTEESGAFVNGIVDRIHKDYPIGSFESGANVEVTP
jgi:N utilization substance protein B